MVHLLRFIVYFLRIHIRRISPCEETDKERTTSSCIPPSKSSPDTNTVHTQADNAKWLLNRQQRARYDPNYQNPSVYYNSYPNGGQYNMHPMPPPMYDPNLPPPPTYAPPAGATKVDPSQWRAEPTRRPAAAGEQSPAYEAPPGPPPPAAAVQASHTGGSTVSNNPYRL